MRTIKVKELNREDFRKYGSYERMVNPETITFGGEPVQFFRDMLPMHIGSEQVSFSICRVCPRPLVIEFYEYHNKTGEGILPIDGDIILHVAYASGKVDLNEVEAYFVPRGTMVTLRPGVFHHAPFAAGETPVSTLIVLPERTYANDCIIVRAEEQDKIAMER